MIRRMMNKRSRIDSNNSKGDNSYFLFRFGGGGGIKLSHFVLFVIATICFIVGAYVLNSSSSNPMYLTRTTTTTTTTTTTSNLIQEDDLDTLRSGFESSPNNNVENKEEEEEKEEPEDSKKESEYPLHQLEVSDSNNTDPDDEQVGNPETELDVRVEEIKTALKASSNPNAPNADGAVVVESLNGLLFSDGEDYEQAPIINVPPPLGTSKTAYKGTWGLLREHEEYFRKNPHKLYIPHLAQPITRQEFHDTFRITSTPVVIPFEYMRHLGVRTRAWTLEELMKKFPYTPSNSQSPNLAYSPKSGIKDGLDFGPALYALSQDAKLVKKKGSYSRNFPRNLMIKSKYLPLLQVSRPPFLEKGRFQAPTLWMGTTTSDTKFHHDCCDNFVMMLSGTKRWYIAPPTDWQGLRPIRCEGSHQSLCWASVKYPNHPANDEEKKVLKSLNSITLDLHAGEMLYLPAGWFHHVTNLGPTVMLNIWTLGCENVGMQLEQDPERTDRKDFVDCPRIRNETAAFLKKPI